MQRPEEGRCVLQDLCTALAGKKAQQLVSVLGGSCFADAGSSLFLRLYRYLQLKWSRLPAGAACPRESSDTHESTEPHLTRRDAQLVRWLKGKLARNWKTRKVNCTSIFQSQKVETKLGLYSLGCRFPDLHRRRVSHPFLAS